MFRNLRTKLTILYTAMFGVTLMVLAATVYLAVADNAKRVVNDELRANGDVFNRLWQMRAEQLHDSADVLARDFGFRAAVASGDRATIDSALDNLRDRLRLDRAFLLTTNGDIVGLDKPLDQPVADALWRALDAKPDASGVLLLNNAPFEAVAAPVRAPDTIGWVVFGAALNDAQMRSFEDLAPIEIHAQPFTRMAFRGWATHDPGATTDLAAYVRLLDQPPGQPRAIELPSGAAIAINVPLASIIPGDGATSTALVLSYPLSRALAPYRVLLWLIVGVGAIGLVFIALGSWALARSLTKPIMALDDAAHRLQQGEDAFVEVNSADEIARLARSFNSMAAGIRERERRIRHQALHEPESKLPNRRAFEVMLRRRARTNTTFAVAAISIDRYNDVRGAIGYELAGDLVRALGARLGSLFTPGRVARLSTDKLGLILDAEPNQDLIALAHKVRRKIDAPLRIGGVAIDVTTTIGLAPARAPIDAGALITQASVAVEQAHKAHSNAALFDADAYGDPSLNLSLMSELYAAMRNGDAWLAHQAKYDIRQERIVGVEALMRWRHPTRGMISPDLFITMAEETGHVRGLTEWVLRRAIEDQAAMRAGGRDLAVSVNVSGRLLGDPGFAARALYMVQAARADICFEITETAVIGNAEQAIASIDQWAEAGIAVSIDDYGSGLSSLSYLKQIRAKELKIDKAFITSVTQSQRDALLVKSTVDLAHSLGMIVTAEGVESQETLALLAGMGCDLAQGYLIGRPLPLLELLASPQQSPQARTSGVLPETQRQPAQLR